MLRGAAAFTQVRFIAPRSCYVRTLAVTFRVLLVNPHKAKIPYLLVPTGERTIHTPSASRWGHSSRVEAKELVSRRLDFQFSGPTGFRLCFFPRYLTSLYARRRFE